jgi:predicted transcriptional regulator
MNLAEAARLIDGTIVTGSEEAATREVMGGYASDLLSDVMANSAKGDIWVTMQKHSNIVAVATLNELAGIVLVNGRAPEQAAIDRAQEERIPIISTGLQAFDVIGILYGRGIRGRRGN